MNAYYFSLRWVQKCGTLYSLKCITWAQAYLDDMACCEFIAKYQRMLFWNKLKSITCLNLVKNCIVWAFYIIIFILALVLLKEAPKHFSALATKFGVWERSLPECITKQTSRKVVFPGYPGHTIQIVICEHIFLDVFWVFCSWLLFTGELLPWFVECVFSGLPSAVCETRVCIGPVYIGWFSF